MSIEEKLRAKQIHAHPCGNGHAQAYNDGIETAIKEINKQLDELPTEAMCDAARAFIMGLDLNIRNFGDMRLHLERNGNPVLPYIKDKAEKSAGAHITKWDVADCIYQYMMTAAPKREIGVEDTKILSEIWDGFSWVAQIYAVEDTATAGAYFERGLGVSKATIRNSQAALSKLTKLINTKGTEIEGGK